MKKTNSLTLNLAFKNLSRQKKRSFLLGGAIAFGFFIVTAIDGLATGAVQNLESQITKLVGGSVIVQGVERLPSTEDGKKGKLTNIIRDPDFVKGILDKSGINYSYYSQRTTISGTLMFEGKQILSAVYGCDFDQEKQLKKSMVLHEGSLDGLSQKDAIILNEKVADALKVTVGEKIIISTETREGQKTFGDFTVIGITEDASFLSSIAVYVRQDTLNELLLNPEGAFDTFTITIPNKSKQAADAQLLENLIRSSGKPITNRIQALKSNPTSPVTAINRQLKDADFEGTMYVAACMNDSIPQLQQVLDIVHMVTTIILIVILLIVMVGISNTYRMVLYERIREIGTERALGMTGKQTGRVFTTEALVLSIIGAVIGFVVAIIAMWIFGLFKFNAVAMSLFLNNGHASFVLSIGSYVVKFIAMIVLTVLAVRGSAKQAARMSPAVALRTVK